MASAGTTGDLYSEADNPQSVLGQPPAPPTPAPPPTKIEQPVQTKQHRMADERPDGTIRDTSAEALRPGNDLGFRNLSDETEQETPPPPPVVEPPKEVAPEPPKEVPPAPPKLYAGKFKTPEELEKGYSEAEKAMHAAQEKAARLERERQAAPSPPPPPKTPEQIAAEEARKNAFLEQFVKDPETILKQYQEQAVQQTQVALQAQQFVENWRKQNPDIAEHEVRVTFEAALLAQSEPELANDPNTLFSKATDKFRQFTGKYRTEGAKEALTTETRVIPLLNGTAQSPATEQPPQKAPLTQDEAFSLHLKMLKEQEQKSHRGLRR